MEQVYYTQCPMGHGLGATGGFQLKRISRGYPKTADFRHLGLRVRMSGLSVASPKTLRYRRDGPWAEIAWLSPRVREFEVAAGQGRPNRQYGRPGGLFAHGLRAGPEALRSLDYWPASLFNWPCWVESDPVPTAGRFLEPMVLDEASLACRRFPTDFQAIAPLADRWGLDFLAALFAGVAEAVRSGRVLFLIDMPGPAESSGVASLIALLTFAFPPGMREALTFSTYSDRPEGLSGFRIQGTHPSDRPDRGALRALGMVADLESRTTDINASPDWAFQLAHWFVERDQVAWESACRDLIAGSPEGEPSRFWQESWLDPAIHFRSRLAWSPDRLVEKTPRRTWRESATWALSSSKAIEWSEAHPPSWWIRAARVVPDSARLATALILQGQLGRPWLRASAADEPAQPDPELARAWGEVVGLWFARRSLADWFKALKAFLPKMPVGCRLAFLKGLNEAVPERAIVTIDALERARLVETAAILMLRGLRALKPKVDSEQLTEVLQHTLIDDSAWRSILTALVREIDNDSEQLDALSKALAKSVSQILESPDQLDGEQRRLDLFLWAMNLPVGPRLLADSLRDALDSQADRASFQTLCERTPKLLSLTLLNSALEAALRPPSQKPAFLWLVEDRLLGAWNEGTVPPTHWAEAYLGLFDSDAPISRRLFGPEAKPRLHDWLTLADQVGDLSEGQADRLRRVESFHEALSQGVGNDPSQIPLLSVRDDERAWLLRTLWQAPGRHSLEALIACLRACRSAWPEGLFSEPSADRTRLAEPIAEALFQLEQGDGLRFGASLDLASWSNRLDRVLDALGAPSEPSERYRPEGLAAEIIASTARLEAVAPLVWTFRRQVLHDPVRYRSLAADFGQDLRQGEPSGPIPVFEHWDRDLEVGTRTAVFFEVVLNACDDEDFLTLTPQLVALLRGSPDPLPWWNADAFGLPRADLRERFARLVPMRPMTFEELQPILSWFEPEALWLAPQAGQPSSWPQRVEGEPDSLSAPARDRWVVLEKLSELVARDWLQWSSAIQELSPLPVRRLETEDRYALAGWLILRTALESEPSLDIRSLADAFRRLNLDDSDRITNWFEALPPDTPGLRDRIQSRREFAERLARAISRIA